MHKLGRLCRIAHREVMAQPFKTFLRATGFTASLDNALYFLLFISTKCIQIFICMHNIIYLLFSKSTFNIKTECVCDTGTEY